MALQMRITETSGEEQPQDAQGDPVGDPIDLTLQGRYRATVEYFDDESPRRILLRQRFAFTIDITEEEAHKRYREAGRRITDTRAFVADQQRHVGQVFPV